MFDYSVLNDHEFEILCRDIMQLKLGKSLFIFPRGVDKGIDICDKNIQPNIVVQVKHYSKSKFSNLKSSLKKEIEKVRTMQPKYYYIMTSQSLTRENKKEIIDLFYPHIPDLSFVIGKEDIDSFLSEKKNSDLVQRNFKLWLNASNVLSIINNQNVFIDSNELMDDIDKKVKLFVDTSAYTEALKKLNEHNILILIGAPGVGKSTISEMLLLYYVKQDYLIRYVTNNDISDVKRAINPSGEQKEIILLDDFLGQHYLKIREEQPNELKTLLSFIGKSKSIKIILNSRVTILNEARESYLNFNKVMELYEGQKYLVDLDKMSNYEKAKILYNHLYFNELPKSYFKNIASNKNYIDLIKHKNYNPRIIEYVTKKSNYNLISPKSYTAYILDKLDHPDDVWADEFENRMNFEDRCLMNTLYSLSDTYIERKYLERAFNARIRNENILDSTTNHFKRVMKRLTNSLLSIGYVNKGDCVSVLNPSINDYLLNSIKNNENEQKKIAENAVYFEQIIRVNKSKEIENFLIKQIFLDEILRFETLKNSMFYYLFKIIVNESLCDNAIKEKFKLSVERSYEDLAPEEKGNYNDLFGKLFDGSLFEFYGLSSIFNSKEKVYHIIKPLTVKSLSRLFNNLKNLMKLDNEIVEEFRVVMNESIFSEIQDEFYYADNDIVSDIMSNDEYLEDDEIEEIAKEQLSNDIAVYINRWFKEDIPLELIIEDDSELIQDLISEYDLSGTISMYKKNDEELENDFTGSENNDDSLIKSMFEK